jgi:hypothetical protein
MRQGMWVYWRLKRGSFYTLSWVASVDGSLVQFGRYNGDYSSPNWISEQDIEWKEKKP